MDDKIILNGNFENNESYLFAETVEINMPKLIRIEQNLIVDGESMVCDIYISKEEILQLVRWVNKL